MFHSNFKSECVPTGAYIPKQFLIKGRYPRITVTSFNNGIDSFVTTEHRNNRVFRNFISVSFLGNMFYHQYKCSLDMKVHALLLNKHQLNKYIAFFIIGALSRNLENCSYGNQLSSKDLPRKSVLLPIDDNSAPDYGYMEQYIKNKMYEKYSKYLDFIAD